MEHTHFYQQIATNRGDPSELQERVTETVEDLLREETSTNRPGVLLGKIQSGKTRAFIGVIALAFDRGYEVAVILTKGTKSLARQTLNRVQKDFAEFSAGDLVHIFDIMTLPDLTPYELGHKLIFVVKKEDDNLRRLLGEFRDRHPVLCNKRILIIDDEADFASLSFRKQDGEVAVGKIAAMIDKLRDSVKSSSFLQVTATPYSLYLQPEEEVIRNGSPLFRPKRPAFTRILPTHPNYVGGDYYFEKASDPTSTAYYFYEDVPIAEREALKEEDGRRLDIRNIMEAKNADVLRRAIVNFVMGAVIRQLQQPQKDQPVRKYSFLFHTEQTRRSHDWQERVVSAICEGLVDAARRSDPQLNAILRNSYDDLQRSVSLAGASMPGFPDCDQNFRRALLEGWVMITKVNSDKDVEALLDSNGQLKLRTPMNIYIGGQILDRGVTIANLIGFYYGRNPRRFQQDTVLQHSRMYGARPTEDLCVTRFYAPKHIYRIMQRIHEFDTALREAFLSGTHERRVYFLRRDITERLISCSPNKLLFSKLTSVWPGRRLLPVGFQTVARTVGMKSLDLLDQRIRVLVGSLDGASVIDLGTAIKLLELAYDNLKFEDDDDDDRRAHVAVLEHLSRQAQNEKWRDKVQLIASSERDIARFKARDRFQDSPDTLQQDISREMAINIPVLLMLRENGSTGRGWAGLPFWWPVIVVPRDAVPTVFAAEAPADEGAAAPPAEPPSKAAGAIV